jgi:hypothetical protein
MTKGIVFMVSPFVGLIVVLSLYAIVSFVAVQLVGAGEGGSSALFEVINVLLGLIGILSVVGFFTVMPYGLYLAMTPDKSKKPVVKS